MDLNADAISSPLHAPRWGLSIALAALGTFAICYPAWPGYTSYDSMLAYGEAVHGVTTAIWPPLHAYLFAISRSLGAGLGGVFLVQTFTLLLGATVVINMLTARAWTAAALCVGFLATFVWIPPQLGVVQAQWRDVTTASFVLLGLVVWLLGARRRRLTGVIGAVALIGLAAAMRYNAIALVAPLLVLMVVRPFIVPGAARKARALVAAGALLIVGVALATTHWRLPDLRPLPAARNVVVTQEFDLIGISACANRTYLPPAMTKGQPITPAEVRQLYDPRHLNMSLGGPVRIALGLPPSSRQLERIKPTDPAASTVGPLWWQAVRAAPGCYLRHRLRVFEEQMGLAPDHVFYPIQGVMQPNPYGFSLAHPALVKRVVAYVLSRSPSPFQRAIWLYGLATVAVCVAAWRRPWSGPFLLTALAGAWAYVAGLFVAGPAADARYIFPSNTVCAVLMLAAVGVLAARKNPAGAEPTGS